MTAVEVQPRRIQQSRAKGFRLADASTNPNGVVSVARPTKWGNRYRVERRDAPNGSSVEWTVVDLDTNRIVNWADSKEDAHREAVERHRAWLRDRPEMVEMFRREHAGKDVACFCGPDVSCHGDTWLRVGAGGEP